MRRFHPDRGKYEALEAERAREINEAYGVLKDSSSRSEYDLKRTYQRKKKSLYLQRVITPPAVFIILLILGLVYLQRPGSVRPAKSSLPSTRGFIGIKVNPTRNKINQVNQIEQIDQINQTRQVNETNEIDQINQTNGIGEINDRNVLNDLNEINQTDHKDEINEINHMSQINEIDQKDETNEINQTNDPNVLNHLNELHLTNQTDEINEFNQTNQKDQKDKTNQTHQPAPMSVSKERKASLLFAKAKTSVTVNNATPLPSKPSHTKKLTNISQPTETTETNQTNDLNDMNAPNDPNVLNHLNELHLTNQSDKKDETNEINQIDQTDQKDESNQIIAQLEQLSPAITEEEVNQFLQLYKEHYIRQDIDGFLSLFSPRALQNGRDDINDIRKMYADFFHQSHELGYQLEDARIEIHHEALIHGLFYEYAVAVEARYQVDQTLIKEGEKKVWRGDIRWILVTENGDLKVLQLDFKPEKSD